MSYVLGDNIFCNVINSGVTANDGLGDPLRTAFWKLFANDSGISGHLEHISGSVVNIGNGLSDAEIKKVTHYTTCLLYTSDAADE